MRALIALTVTLGLAAPLGACSSPGPNAGADAAGSGSADASTATDAAPPPPGYVPLIGRSWTLTAGETDTYKCVRVTVPADMYIAAFNAAAPTGTHHTVLTIATDSTAADGDYDCNAGALDYQMLFASGVGTDDLVFPDGVGIFLAAGSKLNLNLHLFDATDHGLSGTTTIYVKPLASAPAQLAEMVFSGTFTIDIPSDDQPHTAAGGCTLTADANLVALWPHMHQTATHQLVQLTPSGTTTPTTLLDTDYMFAEQKNYPEATPLAVHAGDSMLTTCTYVNNTGNVETFGESSLDEMCFTGIYRYPAQGAGLFSCTTGNPGI